MADEQSEPESGAAESEPVKSEPVKSEPVKSEPVKSEPAKGAEQPKSAILPEPALPAEGTPEGDALRRGLALFQIGDFGDMRATLTPLLSSKNAAVADAAAELLRRIAVDPVQIGFLVGCLVAIVVVAATYLGH